MNIKLAGLLASIASLLPGRPATEQAGKRKSLSPGLTYQRPAAFNRRRLGNHRYPKVHQGSRECARRLRQLDSGVLDYRQAEPLARFCEQAA